MEGQIKKLQQRTDTQTKPNQTKRDRKESSKVRQIQGSFLQVR